MTDWNWWPAPALYILIGPEALMEGSAQQQWHKTTTDNYISLSTFLCLNLFEFQILVDHVTCIIQTNEVSTSCIWTT